MFLSRPNNECQGGGGTQRGETASQLVGTTVVLERETLEGVALRCNVLKAQLCRWNGLSMRDACSPGDILRIAEDASSRRDIDAYMEERSSNYHSTGDREKARVDAVGAIFAPVQE